MVETIVGHNRARHGSFLAGAPRWYAYIILGLLIVNPLVAALCGKFVFGWVLLGEFIFTLMCALSYYPFAPGGLLILEACFLGMLGEDAAHEMMRHVTDNIGVVLLLIFMVPAVGMTKELLLFVFTKVVLTVRSKMALSLIFCLLGAVLSAWLDALTVTAVIMTIAYGFYLTYHAYASHRGVAEHAHHLDDTQVAERHRVDLEEFRGFLRDLLMHGAVGTTLGGVLTLVGEPQNLIIGAKMGWDFGAFFFMMAPVTIPVFFAGIATCLFVEYFRIFGYGHRLPEDAAKELAREDALKRGAGYAAYVIQAIAMMLIVAGLAMHVAEVGFVGLGVLILLSSCGGKPVDEHALARAFGEAMPFASLLVIFFVLVAMIEAQHLFQPIMGYVLSLAGTAQRAAMYLASGALSSISDNVFVGLISISEVRSACDAALVSARQCEMLAIAVNTGTNLPSVATPNGQAAFLFLLTSPIAALIRLGYGRMCWMALPYTIVLTIIGLVGIVFFLE